MSEVVMARFIGGPIDGLETANVGPMPLYLFLRPDGSPPACVEENLPPRMKPGNTCHVYELCIVSDDDAPDFQYEYHLCDLENARRCVQYFVWEASSVIGEAGPLPPEPVWSK